MQYSRREYKRVDWYRPVRFAKYCRRAIDWEYLGELVGKVIVLVIGTRLLMEIISQVSIWLAKL